MDAILFDLDDTLYDQVQPFRTAFLETMGKGEEQLIGDIFTASRKYGDMVFAPSQAGMISMEEMYIYRLYNAFRQYGIEISSEKALEFQRRYEAEQHKIRMDDEMKEILAFCRGKVTMGVITNGPSAHQRDKLKALGVEEWIPESSFIISSEVEIIKPDPEIFHLAEKRLELDAGKYYVGDHYLNDMTGAMAAGWKTIWFNPRKRTLPQGEPSLDYEVHSLQALSELIHSIAK